MLALTLVVLMVLSSCSDAEHKAESSDVRKASKKLVPDSECEKAIVAAGSDLQQLTPECRDTGYVLGVRNGSAAKAVSGVSDTDLLARAQSLCMVGAGLVGENGSTRPLYGDLIRSTARSWSTKPAMVRAILTTLQGLCPAQWQAITGLPRVDGGLSISVEIEGNGSASVAVDASDVAIGPTSVAAPWEHQYHMADPGRFNITVRPEAGAKVGCRVVIAGTTMAEKKPSATPTVCGVTADEIDRQVVGG